MARSVNTITGIPEAMQWLEDTIAEATDFSDRWKILGGYWAKRQTAIFAEGQGTWVPLKQNTVSKKGDRRILIDSGVMRDGLTRVTPRFERPRFAVYGPPKRDRRVMNPAVLAQVGANSAPKRVVVPRLTSNERATWVKVLDDHVKRTIGNAQ